MNTAPLILDGKSLAEKMYREIATEISQHDKKYTLVVILVGDNPASKVYVGNKEKSCAKAGIISQTLHFPDTVSEKTLLAKITELNAHPDITGMIVQLPLPDHIDAEKVIHSISPEKDADGFHPQNLGEMFLSQRSENLAPATPSGIITLLESNTIEISGKNVVVLGRSNIVGKPIATMLTNRSATVTICHSKTQNLNFYTQNADIIIAAVGIPRFVKADMIKKGVVIIDVGIHSIEGALCGDVDFDNVKSKCSAISPVPGGVGPMTVASLINNTVRAGKKMEQD